LLVVVGHLMKDINKSLVVISKLDLIWFSLLATIR
jgi:hypothetical protein